MVFMVVTMTAMILMMMMMMMMTTLMEILCCMMFMVKSHTRQILQSKSRFHHCKLSMHSVQHVLQGLHMSVQGSSHGPPKFTGTTPRQHGLPYIMAQSGHAKRQCQISASQLRQHINQQTAHRRHNTYIPEHTAHTHTHTHTHLCWSAQQQVYAGVCTTAYTGKRRNNITIHMYMHT